MSCVTWSRVKPFGRSEVESSIGNAYVRSGFGFVRLVKCGADVCSLGNAFHVESSHLFTKFSSDERKY